MSSSAHRRATGRDDFLTFYDHTFEEAYRYAGRLCGSDRQAAEDLVQDAYMAVLRQWRAANSERSQTLGIGYLITTIRHRFLDGVRNDERERQRLRLVHSVPEPDDGPDGGNAVTSQLAHLPGRDRTALVLRYVDDLPVPEVADAMGLSVHATESLLARARARLRGKDADHG